MLVLRMPYRLILIIAGLFTLARSTTDHCGIRSTVVDIGYAKYKGYPNIYNVTEWLGIRYAAPPLGDLRFRAPIDPYMSPGIIEAKEHGPTCPTQSSKINGFRNGTKPACEFADDSPDCVSSYAGVVGKYNNTSEDCLFLDVYVPSNATKESKLPVMIYIPGGGYTEIGNPNLNGTQFIRAADYNVIVVYFNYRTGPFGFLASEAVREDGALNAGILDQRKVFRWVRDHIESFGGDPNHVVLGGDSAGAGSVAIALTSYGAEFADFNLFHGAIIESVYFPRQPRPSELEFQYQQFLNTTGCDSLKCLRSANSSVLQQANVAQPYPGRNISALFPFGPCTDGNLIQDNLYALFRAGKILPVPVLIGDDTDEGTYFAPEAQSVQDMDNFLLDNYPGLNSSSLDTINRLYPLEADAQSPNRSLYFSATSKAFGEATFTCAGLLISDAVEKKTSNHIWNYRYNVIDPANVASGLGVPHTYEVSAVFGPDDVSPPSPSSSSYRTSNKPIIPLVMGYWSSFVRTLSPNTLSYHHSPAWQPYSDGQRLVLQTNQTRMEAVPSDQKLRCEFWASIGDAIEQ